MIKQKQLFPHENKKMIFNTEITHLDTELNSFFNVIVFHVSTE